MIVREANKMRVVYVTSIALLLTLLALSSSAQEARPAHCASVPDSVLGGLAAPYARKSAPDGSVYCEGLLRAPIAFQPLRVISVKQLQDPKLRFFAGATTNLNWCDQSKAAAQLTLRSTLAPMFALDALHTGPFEWPADTIAKWQPDWNVIAARGIREIEIDGRKYQVHLPLRIGTGHSSRYSFMVQGQIPVRLTTALIEPVSPAGPPDSVDIVASSASAKNTWTITIPFDARQKGVFRVTLGEGVEQAGASTEPIYVFHGGCSTR